MSQTAKEVFDGLPKRFNAEGAKDWKAAIQFHLSGENGGHWNVCVENGQCTVSDGDVAEPTATVEMPAETWVGISNGSVNPMTAYMKGQIKAKGKMGDVMKLNDPRVFAKG